VLGSTYGNWTFFGLGVVCRYSEYLTFYNGPDRPDPGLVPDGASCDTGKVTVSDS